MSDDPGEFPNCARVQVLTRTIIAKAEKEASFLCSKANSTQQALKKYYAISINLSRLRPLLTLN